MVQRQPMRVGVQGRRRRSAVSVAEPFGVVEVERENCLGAGLFYSSTPALLVLHNSTTQREKHHRPPSASSFAISAGRRIGLTPVEMDGFGIVYLIENAQQFWSGASQRQYLITAALDDAHIRARGYSQNPRKCFTIPS